MTRDEFNAFRSACRKGRMSAEIQHNGRRWSVSKYGCDRLGNSGCYDRPRGAMVAMCLTAAHDCRARLKLPRACYGQVSLARDYRTAGHA